MSSETDLKPEITITGENISPVYKETALKAVKEMPVSSSHKEQSKFIWHKMGIAHPEVAWGCEAINRKTGTWANTSKMWYSSKASHVITIKVGDDLSFRILALQSKDNDQIVEGLWDRVNQLETKIKENKSYEADVVRL